MFSRWDFEPVKTTRRVADGRIDVAADRPARISVPVQWGRYRLEVSTGDRSGPLAWISSTVQPFVRAARM